MVTFGVPMRPVNHAALRIPVVYAIEQDFVAHFEADNPGRQIDIVCYERGLRGREPKDEALMLATIVVVRQNSCHFTFSLNLKTARSSCESFLKSLLSVVAGCIRVGLLPTVSFHSGI